MLKGRLMTRFVRRIFPAVLLLALLLGLAAPGVGHAAGPQIGVVDYTYLINNHPGTPAANEALNAERTARQQEYDAKAAGLNDQEKQALSRQLTQLVQQKRLELLRPIAAGIDAAMKSVAEAKGLIAVAHKNTIAWGGVDITEDVLKKITGK